MCCHGCEEIGEVIYISGAELICPEALRSLITPNSPPSSIKDCDLLKFPDSLFLKSAIKILELKKNVANKHISFVLILMFHCATKATHVRKIQRDAN